jgi:O-antigen/teichoic acid export membrane protein
VSHGAWGREARSGIAWSIFSVAGGRVMTLASILVLARLLVPADFGVVAAILVFLALLELGSDLGMKATVVYEQERHDDDRLHSAFTINLLIALVLTGIGVAAAPLVAGFFGVPEEASLFRLAMLGLLLTGLGNIQDALFMRDLDFRRRTVPELVRGLVQGTVSVALALAGVGAAALVIGLLAGRAVWVVLLWVMSAYRPRLRVDRAIARSMTAYGSSAVGLEVIAVIVNRMPDAVIGRVLGPAALGIYTVAQRVPELVVSNVSWGFSRVSFSALSKMRAEDREGLAAGTTTLLRYQGMAAVPLATLLAILALPATVVLFGEVWAQAGIVMAALAVVAALDAVATPFGDLLKSIGRQPTLIAINLVYIPPLLVTLVLLAPVGLGLLAWALAAQSLLHLLILGVVGSRAAGIRLAAVAGAFRPALAGALGVGVGAGTVRLLWPALEAGPLLAGVLAGCLGGLVALHVFAPRELSGMVAGVRRALAARRTRRAGSAPLPRRLGESGQEA